MHDIFKEAYQEALVTNISNMTDLTLESFDFEDASSVFNTAGSPGVASIVGFIGDLSGRSLLFIPAPLAEEITKILIDEDVNYQSEDVMFTISEINNVLSGQAITVLNNKLGFSLWLSPPSVFAGGSIILSTPKIANYQLQARVKEETIYLNLAIEGGKE